MSVSFLETLPSKLRWKLKHTLGFSDRVVTKFSFWLFWKLCKFSSNFKVKKNGISEQGILIASKLEDETIGELNEKINELENSSTPWLYCTKEGEVIEENKTDKELIKMVKHVPNLCDNFGSKYLLNIAETYFGEPLRRYYGAHYRVLSIVSYITSIKDSKENDLSFLWHKDDHPSGLIKGFIYLTDVEANNGPLIILPGTHKKSFKKYIDKNQSSEFRYIESVFEKINIKPMELTLEKGSSFLINANCIHKAGEVKSGKRRVLCFYFLPSFDTAIEHYQKHGVIDITNFPDRIFDPIWSEK
jgi:hypothetical protein